MNKKSLLKKSLVVGTIVLFIGAGVATGIGVKINRNDINEKTLNALSNQNICSLTFNTFDKTEEKQKNVNLPVEVAKNIYKKFEELTYMSVYKPRSDETQNLNIEFVDLLDTYGLIPAGLSKDYVLSLLNPSWLKNKQKTPKTKTTLEKTNATAAFSKISSVGSGTTFPPFLLPRPRTVALWNAFDGQTMIVELLTAKIFVAKGAQSGTMLGFIGMGLSFSVPGILTYGFVGYALSTKVSADIIEFYFPKN